MLKNNSILIPITADIKCHLMVLFEANKLAKRYQLRELYFHSKIVAHSWDELVDFVSIFDAFNRNSLIGSMDYHVGEVRFRLVANKDKSPKLNAFMYRSGQEALNCHYSKYETLLIANKLSKIISKLDLEVQHV